MNIFDWSMNQTFNAYYDDCCKILGLNYYHSGDSLKKAYHKKVFESHPDKGGTTDNFIKVNEAYKFLSSLVIENPKKSKCRESKLFDKSRINTNININKSINMPIKENENKNAKNANKGRTKDINYKLEIELSDAYFGARKIIKLNRNRICKTCKENNLLYTNNENCHECGGKKYSSQIKEVQLIIKPGTYSGCKVIFKGEGEEYIGKEPGDIIFQILIKENKNFLRKGSDLYIYKAITISEFLGMENILINLFEKLKFYVNKNNIIINPGEVKTIIGKGFPFFDDNNHRGNLHIKFNISFPLNLKLEQKKIIKNVFNGNYMQYIKKDISIEKKISKNIIPNKNNNLNKNINNNGVSKSNNFRPIKKSTFIPKFNLKKENNKQNEKLKNKMINNNKNNFFRSKTELNKSFNKKSQINNQNKKEKENENELNKLEIYELVKFDDSLVNRSYFYEKNNNN